MCGHYLCISMQKRFVLKLVSKDYLGPLNLYKKNRIDEIFIRIGITLLLTGIDEVV